MVGFRILLYTSVLLYSLTSAVSGAADEMKTVQSLYGLCKSEPSSHEYTFCIAYIGAIGDFMHFVDQLAKIEPSSKPTNPLFSFALCAAPSHGAMIQAFINWAETNPQKWTTNKTAGVIMALQEPWPCK
jgi:hypothetical protein